jgi:hypothetical protein
MQQINSVRELKRAIQELESDQKQQAEFLRKQFEVTVASLNPKKLIMSAINDFLTSPLVYLVGSERLKSFGHKLIGRVFGKKQSAPE